MNSVSQIWQPQAGDSGLVVENTSVLLRPPYLIYFGDVKTVSYAKTGFGLIEWRPDICVGQLRKLGCKIDSGLTDMSIKDAVRAGVKSLIIGIASPGGTIPDHWLSDLVEAASAGLDIVSGMHVRLSDFPALNEASKKSGARLIDIRTPPKGVSIGTGEKRSGKRLLTVGTDCAVGKKYTALAIEKEMRARGLDAEFRATGQTGIMIAGSGIAIDSVVSDFISGAAEQVSPVAPDRHWDIIEGQGSLAHPGFAGVSLGLLHGSQPDALVLCHDPSRNCIIDTEKYGHYPIQPLNVAMEQCLTLATRVNPDARFVGVSVNSSHLSENERGRLFEQYRSQTGLPVTDPIRDGVQEIVDYMDTENR